MNLVQLHREAATHTAALVEGITDRQWTQSTPCSEWDVRALVNHLVAENLWVPEMLAGRTVEDVGTALDGDQLGDDPVGAYRHSAKLAHNAVADEGALDRPVAVSYGPVPGQIYVQHRLIDLVVHGWDVARATEQDTTIDEELLDAVYEIVEGEQDELAASGAFGSPVPVSADADRQARLLAMLGRQA